MRFLSTSRIEKERSPNFRSSEATNNHDRHLSSATSSGPAATKCSKKQIQESMKLNQLRQLNEDKKTVALLQCYLRIRQVGRCFLILLPQVHSRTLNAMAKRNDVLGDE